MPSNAMCCGKWITLSEDGSGFDHDFDCRAFMSDQDPAWAVQRRAVCQQLFDADALCPEIAPYCEPFKEDMQRERSRKRDEADGSMGKIVDRGRKYVGAFRDPEGEIGSILTWKIWYVMDSGQRYSMSIDIAVPQPAEPVSQWTDDDLKAFGDRVNAENQEQLDRAQTNFESMGPTWKLP